MDTPVKIKSVPITRESLLELDELQREKRTKIIDALKTASRLNLKALDVLATLKWNAPILDECFKEKLGEDESGYLHCKEWDRNTCRRCRYLANRIRNNIHELESCVPLVSELLTVPNSLKVKEAETVGYEPVTCEPTEHNLFTVWRLLLLCPDILLEVDRTLTMSKEYIDPDVVKRIFLAGYALARETTPEHEEFILWQERRRRQGSHYKTPSSERTKSTREG
ncbi:MAG: hypothetical protein K6C38_00770 [Saccharofermentans sp.]|nr:hypothetical protein [Saccharofermentans sp.]